VHENQKPKPSKLKKTITSMSTEYSVGKYPVEWDCLVYEQSADLLPEIHAGIHHYAFLIERKKL